MKFTFILLAFIFNFFNPNFIKAEEIVDSSNNQIENTTKVKSTNNEISDFKKIHIVQVGDTITSCLLYTSPSPRDATLSRMPSSA